MARSTDAGDRELVQAVRAGDDAAFEELYRRYSRRVAGYVCRMVSDPDRAEDITQEAFFSALRRLRRTDAEIAFKPWIFEIAKNAAIDHFRRTSRAEEVSLHPEDGGLRPTDHVRLVGGGPAPEAAYEGKERLDNLRGAFDELSESHSRILVLRELEGLSYREIGERMELTRPAVESTLFRARRRLNEEYAEIDTGARCVAIGLALDRLADGMESPRDRRRVGRHVVRCSSCRRHARELGVPVDTGLRTRVAALLPLPLLLRRRRGGGQGSSPDPAATGGYAAHAQQAASTWAPALVSGGGVEGAAQMWAKAGAIVATLALAGGGAALQATVVDAERGGAGGAPPARDGGADGGKDAGAPADGWIGGAPADAGGTVEQLAGARDVPAGRDGGVRSDAPGSARDRGGADGGSGSDRSGGDAGGDSGGGLTAPQLDSPLDDPPPDGSPDTGDDPALPVDEEIPAVPQPDGGAPSADSDPRSIPNTGVGGGTNVVPQVTPPPPPPVEAPSVPADVGGTATGAAGATAGGLTAAG